MVKAILIRKEHPKRLTHFQRGKKREKRGWGKDRNWSQKEESSQANKQTHKLK